MIHWRWNYLTILTIFLKSERNQFKINNKVNSVLTDIDSVHPICEIEQVYQDLSSLQH
jgi:hypothetical protein